MVYIRQDWELVLLRRKYLDVAGPAFDTASASDKTVDLKMQLSFSLSNFEDRWVSTRYWLAHRLPMRNVLAENKAGRSYLESLKVPPSI